MGSMLDCGFIGLSVSPVAIVTALYCWPRYYTPTVLLSMGKWYHQNGHCQNPSSSKELYSQLFHVIQGSYSAYFQIPWLFPWLFQVFHDFPGPTIKFHEFPGLEMKFFNSMTFQVFQDLYQSCHKIWPKLCTTRYDLRTVIKLIYCTLSANWLRINSCISLIFSCFCCNSLSSCLQRSSNA